MADLEKDKREPTVAAILAALIDGDRELDAEAAAIVLGNLPESTFYQYAARLDFPRPVKIGKGRKWRRSSLLEWADKERDRQNRAA